MGIINESPEAVKVGDEVLHWSDDGAYAFGFDKNRNAYISDESGRHANIKDIYVDELEDESYPKGLWSRNQFLYSGRFWRSHNIISFWEYPKAHMLFAYLKKLEEEFRERSPEKKPLDFKNTTWYINKWSHEEPHIENVPIGSYEGFNTDGSDSLTHSSRLVERKLKKIIRKVIKEIL